MASQIHDERSLAHLRWGGGNVDGDQAKVAAALTTEIPSHLASTKMCEGQAR